MIDIVKRLSENAALVEEVLGGYTAKKDPDFAPVQNAAAYSLLAPRAKRIRPTLVLECCRMLGGDDGAVNDAEVLSVVVEILRLFKQEFRVMVNHRGILNAIILGAGVG